MRPAIFSLLPTVMPELVAVPPGCFVMGTEGGDRFANATERPAHQVEIRRNLWVARHPVTEAEWAAFSGEGPVGDLPVVNVSWYDACAYAGWLQEITGRPFRLLTEAEWEYCCRAGTETIFSTGNLITPSAANFLHDESGDRIGLGQRTRTEYYSANPFGLCDMHGNVCEWVADPWHPNYIGSPPDGRVWNQGCIEGSRVIRGGAWDYMPRLLRSAWRDWLDPLTKRDNLGFRVVCDDT